MFIRKRDKGYKGNITDMSSFLCDYNVHVLTRYLGIKSKLTEQDQSFCNIVILEITVDNIYDSGHKQAVDKC